MGDATDKSPVSIGDVVAGKYRVDRVVGAGGMGVVVAATHVELDQKVALKFVLPNVLANERSKERFMREARAAVRLHNEHVARVYDVGTIPDGTPYLVMELLEGCDLHTLAKQHRPMRSADAAEYVLQACEGLIEAHQHGIVHRDLKPQNLFVTRRLSGAPLVKILDFGISKFVGATTTGDAMSLTQSSVVLGSPLYMAPEQLRSAKNVDIRGDIWSLGVILFELLIGRVPFDGETMTELCLRVVNDPPPPPRELRPDLPEGLAQVVLTCLAKEPENRYASVAMLAEALEPFSASAERGGADRAWRSLVATGEQLDAPMMLRASESRVPGASATPGVYAGGGGAAGARTPSGAPGAPAIGDGTDKLTTWGGTHVSDRPPASGGRRKRAFVGGVVAGAALMAALAVAAIVVVRGRNAASANASAPSGETAAVAAASTAPPTAATTTVGTTTSTTAMPPMPVTSSATTGASAPATASAGGEPAEATMSLLAAPPKSPATHAKAHAGATHDAPAAPSSVHVSPNGAPILH